MGKKTGVRGDYITYGGAEEKVLIGGKEMGVTLHSQKQTHYTMIPKQYAGVGAKRSKQQWLGKDVDTAVVKFRAIVAQIQGKQETKILATVQDTDVVKIHKVKLDTKPVNSLEDLRHNLAEYAKSDEMVMQETGESIAFVPESQHIAWLIKELQNPQELARKTGFEEFNRFHALMAEGTMKLSKLFSNYTESIQYAKITDEDEKQKVKATWDLFVDMTGATTAEQITLEQVKAFEKYLHTHKYYAKKSKTHKNYTDKTINHYKSRITKVFNYNIKKVYLGNKTIRTILDYFNAWEALDINTSDTIAAQAITQEQFMKLYDTAKKKKNYKLMALLSLCLNTATYIKEVARFKISDIDLDEQTLMTQRNKTGHCRKFAYLWDRTVWDIKRYLATRKDSSDVLFISREGTEHKGGEGLRTAVYKLRKESGLLKQVEFQHLRDTFQTLANEIGVSEYHSDLVMGHSAGKTSDRYSHRRIHNELKEACLKVEREFFKRIVKQ